MDKIMNQIVYGNTNFASYFGNRSQTPTTIFDNPKYTTPMFANHPSPLASKFPVPGTSDVKSSPEQIQIQLRTEPEHHKKSLWLFCCRSTKCNIF